MCSLVWSLLLSEAHLPVTILGWLKRREVFICWSSQAVCAWETARFEIRIKTQTRPDWSQTTELSESRSLSWPRETKYLLVCLPYNFLSREHELFTWICPLWHRFSPLSVFWGLMTQVGDLKCEPLPHSEAAVQLCPLLVHPCCRHSSLVRNTGVTRCFPSPFSGP